RDERGFVRRGYPFPLVVSGLVDPEMEDHSVLAHLQAELVARYERRPRVDEARADGARVPRLPVLDQILARVREVQPAQSVALQVGVLSVPRGEHLNDVTSRAHHGDTDAHLPVVAGGDRR